MLLSPLKHSSNAVLTLLAIVRIRNHKLLLLLVRKRNYRYSLAVGIGLDGTDVNKERHLGLVNRLVFRDRFSLNFFS